MSINTVQGVPDHYLEFQDVFQKPSKPVLPPHREYDCAIPLEPGTIVPFGRMYSLTEPEKEVLKEYLDENIQSGLIVPSSSPAGAPLFFVPKKTKDLRPCLDFRGLNKITIKDRYPLPLIRDILEAIRGAQRFTKLDLRGAYHLLRIKEGDKWKTAFRTPFGHFEYRVMPFGLTNAPAIFQRFMDSVFSDLLNQTVVIYLDDILIYSRNPELHSSHVKQVLQRLRAHQLFCKPEKCEFDMTEVKYLGYHLSPTGIAMDLEKVQAILEWPSPSSIKETQCFLGLANFYRQFILDFARQTSHITHTLKKENLKKGFVWTEAAEAAFQELKRAFTQAPILRHPDTTKQFIVVTDASERAIGAVLLQRQEDDGLEHPVFYLSHILSTAEQHYSVLERELLALKTACLEWRQFLMGSKEPFERYMKKAADKRRATNPDYHPQDKVWLSSKFLPSRLSQNKFTPRYYGPFRILQLVNPLTVRLHLPHTWKIHPVFHVSQLKPYVPDPYSRQFPCPPPVLVDDVPEYEVQEICDSRLFHKRLQYLIHWKGYPLSECSWEDASSVHAPLLIQRFHCLFPLKPGPSGGGPTVAPRGAARAESSTQAGRSARAAHRVARTRRAPSLSCAFRGPRLAWGLVLPSAFHYTRGL
ncbi:hypothetical protein NDU88_003857 [Pleurodeles waltl]|uniref:ribonuclease H n=1 Tax=Pleurodeles waltl TaxID=8319 RepID=A0AAV7UE09_PLEWA|nr:hypothetical protein NDU88_003857 [Pleurodeles waltl]